VGGIRRPPKSSEVWAGTEQCSWSRHLTHAWFYHRVTLFYLLDELCYNLPYFTKLNHMPPTSKTSYFTSYFRIWLSSFFRANAGENHSFRNSSGKKSSLWHTWKHIIITRIPWRSIFFLFFRMNSGKNASL
jgi:hypothetical protein